MKRILHILLLVCIISFTTCEEENFDNDGFVESEEQIGSSETSQPENTYQSPESDPSKYYFADHFDDLQQFNKKWIQSKAKKDGAADDIAKYDGVWSVELPQRKIFDNDLGLVLKSKAKHAAISSHLNRPFVFNTKPLVVQYEVTLQNGQECGGSYIKLLSAGKETKDLSQFHDKTPYTIMFGPDKCGNDYKLHFIFRHVNPINGTITEKHAKKPKDRLEEPFKDKQPHLYQLVINPDNTFKVRVDNNLVNEGSLLTDFTPPVNPERLIDDPTDKKPEDWDEREKIPDPTANKPDDWDEDAPPQIPDANAIKPEGWLDDVEEMIPDPNAEKPADWDVEMDGEYEAPLIPNPLCENAVGCGLWKAPLIPNPDYKGKWRAPLIDNPNYQGKWAPRKIPNPDFFEDLNPFKMTTISAVGIELWSMSDDILFDNILITDDEDLAIEWAEQTYNLKRKHLDIEAETFASKLQKIVNENPWIVAVMVVVVGLPVCVVIYVACCTAPKEKEPLHPKKTDEVTADDQEPAEMEKSERKTKEDLNLDENLLQKEDDVVPESDEKSETEDVPDEEEVDAPVEQSAKTETTSTRKRKSRKE
jgi:calnexin